MPRLVPLLAVGLVLVAGCTASPGTAPTPTATTTTDTPTRTSSPTRTATPTVPDGRLAPGVTDDGIANRSALLAAHERALRDRGFELVVERSFSSESRTYESEQHVVVAPGLGRLRGHTTSLVRGNRTHRRTWLDAEMRRMLIRLESGGETRYRIPPLGLPGDGGRARYLAQLVQVRQLSQLLRGGEFAVTGVNVTPDGRRYTLVGRNFSTEGAYGEREVRLSIGSNGVIYALKATGETADGDSFTYGYHLLRLGVESVDRPDWVAAAPEPVDTFPTLGFQNCTNPYLVLENPGPDSIPAGSVIRVTLNDTAYEATLDTAVAAGGRRALYLDASGDLRVTTVGDVPTSRTAMPNEADFTVVTAENMLLSSGAVGFGCSTGSERASSGASSATDAG